MSVYDFDEDIRKSGFDVIAGVDEAGRGPLAGPVVAAAVVLPKRCYIKNIRDSKKIKSKELEQLYEEILNSKAKIGIGIISAGDIDRFNILTATKFAMHKAVMELKITPDIILVDALHIPSIKTKQIPIIKGDEKSASISAASIVAKVTRDRIMIEFHNKYPLYGFDRHKGYATKEHIENIRVIGPCSIHRKTFDRVMTLELPFQD